MSTKAESRLLGDFKRLQIDPPFGISAAPIGNDIMLWNAVICGPNQTPFEDGTFKLTLEFSDKYPYEPPAVKFLSKMFHPNIFEEDGRVGLDILENSKWSPAFNVSAILVSVQSLLSDPNPDRSAHRLAGRLFKKNQAEYLKKVKECVVQSWSDDTIITHS